MSERIGQHFNNTVEHMKVKRDAEGSTVYKGLKWIPSKCVQSLISSFLFRK